MKDLRVNIHLDIVELHGVIDALQKLGGQELADRLLDTTDFTRRQLIEVYGCDPKQVKALTNPYWIKQWGDSSTHYFRLHHPEVARLMRESEVPAANWIIDLGNSSGHLLHISFHVQRNAWTDKVPARLEEKYFVHKLSSWPENQTLRTLP